MAYPFTIVIPTYNEAGGIERLLRALDAAVQRTRPRWRDHRGRRQLARRNRRDRRSLVVGASGPVPAPPRQARPVERRHRRLEGRAQGVARARRDGCRFQPRHRRAAEDGRSARVRSVRTRRRQPLRAGRRHRELAEAPHPDVARRVHAGAAANRGQGRDQRLHFGASARRSKASSSIRSVSRSASK